MGRVRPSAIEHLAIKGRVLTRPGEHVLEAGVGGSLGRGHKARAHPCRVGPQRQGGDERPARGNTASGNKRRIRNRPRHGRHQRHSRDLAPDVTPGLPALGDDHVGALIDGTHRFLGRSHRHQGRKAGRYGGFQIGPCIAPEEGDQRAARRDDGINALTLVPLQDQIDSERMVGLLAS